MVVECYRENELFYVWYEVSFEEFKSVSVGVEIVIKENWKILEVQGIEDGIVKTILSLQHLWGEKYVKVYGKDR